MWSGVENAYRNPIANPVEWMDRLSDASIAGHFSNGSTATSQMSFDATELEGSNLKTGDVAYRVYLQDHDTILDVKYYSGKELLSKAKLFRSLDSRSAFTACLIPLFTEEKFLSIQHAKNLLLPTVNNNALKIQNTALKILAVFTAALIDIATLPIRIMASPIELFNRVGLGAHELHKEFNIGPDVEHVKVFISMVKKVPDPNRSSQNLLFKATVGININLKRCYSYRNEDAHYRGYILEKNLGKERSGNEQPKASIRDKALKFLGLKGFPTGDEIKRAYRKLALALHPDKHADKVEDFKKLNQYYQFLLDPTNYEVSAAFQ